METQDVMSSDLTCLFKALAMDLAMLVLPTPGGPWKHKILPCVVPLSWLTAINSCNEKTTIREQAYELTHTVKPALSSHSHKDKKLVFKTNYRLMQVKSIAECSNRAFCNTFDLHKATICL